MKKVVVSNENKKEDTINKKKSVSIDTIKEETPIKKETKTKKIDSTPTKGVKTITIGVDDEDGNFELLEDSEFFRTTKGKFTSRFAKSLKEKELVKLSNNEHDVTLGFIGKRSNIKKINRTKGKVLFSNKERSSISFENFEEGLDLNYEVHSQGIKESIIVKERQDDYTFDFTMNIGSLTPRYNEDTRCIELCENDEVIYRILSPFMQDAKGEISHDCSYEIEQDGEVLNLTLKADVKWINSNERVLPVVIDPTLEIDAGSIASFVQYGSMSKYSFPSNTFVIGVDTGTSGSTWWPRVTLNRQKLLASAENIEKIYLTFAFKSFSSPYSSTDTIQVVYNEKTYASVKFSEITDKLKLDITELVMSTSGTSITFDVITKRSYPGSLSYVCVGNLSNAGNTPKISIDYIVKEINYGVNEFATFVQYGDAYKYDFPKNTFVIGIDNGTSGPSWWTRVTLDVKKLLSTYNNLQKIQLSYALKSFSSPVTMSDTIQVVYKEKTYASVKFSEIDKYLTLDITDLVMECTEDMIEFDIQSKRSYPGSISYLCVVDFKSGENEPKFIVQVADEIEFASFTQYGDVSKYNLPKNVFAIGIDTGTSGPSWWTRVTLDKQKLMLYHENLRNIKLEYTLSNFSSPVNMNDIIQIVYKEKVYTSVKFSEVDAKLVLDITNIVMDSEEDIIEFDVQAKRDYPSTLSYLCVNNFRKEGNEPRFIVQVANLTEFASFVQYDEVSKYDFPEDVYIIGNDNNAKEPSWWIKVALDKNILLSSYENLKKIKLEYIVNGFSNPVTMNDTIEVVYKEKTYQSIRFGEIEDKLTFDITELVMENSEKLIEFDIVAKNNSNSISYLLLSNFKNVNNAPRFIIKLRNNLDDDLDLPENEYPIGRAGTTFVNLKNGSFRHVHKDASIMHNCLSLNIEHIFDSLVFDKDRDEINPSFMGKGWRTNLHQYLIKSNSYNENLGSKDITYIDGKGLTHVLHEHWFYKEDDEKIFVNRADVFLDADQKIKFKDSNDVVHEVQLEVKSDDNLNYIAGSNMASFRTLKNRKKYYLECGFGNLEVDVENEEHNHLSFCYYNPNSGKKVWVDPDTVVRSEDGMLIGPRNHPVFIDTSFTNKIIKNSDGTYSITHKRSSFNGEPDVATQVDSEGWTIKLIESVEEEEKVLDIYVNEDIANINEQIKSIESYINDLERSKTISFYSNLATLKKIDDTFGITAKQKRYVYFNKGYVTLSDELQKAKNIFFKKCGLVALEYFGKSNGDSTDFSSPEKYAESFKDITSISKSNESDVLEVMQSFSYGLQKFSDSFNYTQTTNSMAISRELENEMQDLNLTTTITTLSNTIESQINEYSKLLENLANYKQQLENLKKEKNALIENQMRQVNDLVIDTDGNLLGFDGYGRLILVQDVFENNLNIEYGYKDNESEKLLSISSETLTTKFNYDKDTGLLKTIIDSHGRKTKFKYNENNELISIKYNDGKKTTFDYSDSFYVSSPLLEGNKIIKDEEDESIHVKTYCLKTSYDEYDAAYKNVIDKNTVLLGDEDVQNVSDIHYMFDSEHNLTTIKNGKTEKESTYHFDSIGNIVKQEDTKTTLVRFYEDKLLISEIGYKNVEEVLDTIAISQALRINQFNLSDAKFKSKLPVSNMLGIRVNTFVENINTLSFKVRAKVVTSISETESKEKIFEQDYKEINLSTVVLPICINHDLPTVVSIEITCDNSNFNSTNVKSINLIKLESGTIYTYDDEEHLIKEQDGYNTTIYEEYNDNDVPLKVTSTNIYGEEVVTIYSYNNENKLTNIEDSKGNIEEYYYNDKGQCIEKRSYNKKDASLMKVEKIEYDEQGRGLSSKGSIKDLNGNYPIEEISYLPNTNIQNRIKGANGETTCYTYDFNTGDLLSISSSAAGINNSTAFTYNYGLLTSLSHHGMKVDYIYDGKGRRIRVDLNGKNFLWNTYNEYCYDDVLEKREYGTLTQTTFADGYYTDTLIDNEGRIRKTTFSSDLTYGDCIYEYEDDRVVKVTSNKTDRDNDESITEVLEKTYDNKNNVTDYTKVVNDDQHFYQAFEYDRKNRLTLEEISIQDGDVLQIEYQYDENNLVTSLSFIDLFTVNLNYDALNRVKHQSLEINTSSQQLELCHEYSYLQQDENSLDLIAEDRAKIILRKESSEDGKLVPSKVYMTETSKYTYDVNGNITEIDTDDSITRYQYDKLNRLIREDNPKLEKTFVYKYDNAGNVILKKTYDYTLDDKLYSPQVDEFIYECEGWNDQLIFFNGKQCEYDEMGRPIVYKDNKLTWETNNNLLEFNNNNGLLVKYSYDSNGIRRKKVINDVETTFITDGTKILRQITGNVVLTFRYALNKLIGFQYNNGGITKEYIYLRNIQGDIISIINEEGNEVGGYVYDAWGNHIVHNINKEGEIQNIASLNPFRYRGYYFDVETGLFYCNSRYYDPETGRFISPDTMSILDETRSQINGLNLYMYCGNNPVMYVDPNGNSFLSIIFIGFIVGFIIGGGIEIGKQIYSNGWNPTYWDWKQIGLSALGGGVAGAISAIPIPGSGFLSYLGTFAVGGMASVAGGLISGSVDSWESALFAFGIGGVANVIGRGLSDIVKNIKISKQINSISSKAQSIASMSAKDKSLAIWNMIGTDNFTRNAFKNWNYNQILNLLLKEGSNQLSLSAVTNLTRYIVYSSIISSFASGWY